MRWKWVFIAPLAILGLALFIFIGGEAVMLLWNWLLPPLFGFKELTFWQALGILALCRILFGMGFRGGARRVGRGPLSDRVIDRVSERLGERWDRMSPEERERLRQRLRERCGMDPLGG